MMTVSTIASLYSPFPQTFFKFNSISSHPIQCCHFSKTTSRTRKLGLFSSGRKNLGFVVKSVSSGGEGEELKSSSSKDVIDDAGIQPRGQSTMPERFRYLTEEVPEPPVRWPYFIALGFLLYAWRTVLWELHNWQRAATSILKFIGYLLKLALALIFHYIGDPITATIRAIETAFYSLRAFYSQIIAYTPITELSAVIMLTSVILAISEVASPNSVDNQWHQLSISGLTGYFAVRGMIGDLVFWTLLFGLFSFSRFVKKNDYVSSVLPVAAVLAGVGEPWVRIVAMGGFLVLAVVQYSKNPPQEVKDEVVDATTGGRRVPIPLLCAALAIGVRVAARWAGYRHLTWMVV